MKPLSHLVKSSNEIELVKKACQLSSELHQLVMSEDLTGLSENDLAKKITTHKQASQNLKSSQWAYPLIIGCGIRANQLHAKPTTKKIKNSELVLIDMGLKYKGYCSDITRTWPVSKKFTTEQKEIYQIVLSAQKEVIKKIKPYESLVSLHEFCQQTLLEKLLSKSIINKSDLETFFPHKTSHWIGKNVHDNCPYFYKDDTPIQLSAGMLFTVEPGLYFKNLKSKYNNIAVRIEDVVLVTEKGHQILTTAPKEIEEIEYLRSHTKCSL